MSRIDVKTLVLAFENRISELNKNTPDLVPQKTISFMLENAVEEEMKNHFVFLIKQDVKDSLQKEFKKQRNALVKAILKNILTDSFFRESIEKKIKNSIINNIA
jgi:Na+-translocating ferredoxin:NAD+ oxidoreductase RnfG subunit